jgi:BirA family biotin operon repressor/biotin-[acetyl-CoA-carboxylase] ligase
LVAAVAAARAIQTVSGLAPALKWPNDILLGDRKLGGVLCESSGLSAKAGPAPEGIVIVGIGLNVNTPRSAFADDLRETATSLATEGRRPFDRATLLATLLKALEDRYALLGGDRASEAEDEYRALCSTIGRRVRIELAGGERLEGRAEAVLADGSLRVACQAPEARVMDLHAGDVIHLR